MEPTTYIEACEHAEANHQATNGLVTGGDYMIRFDNGTVAEVKLRIGPSGIAHPVEK